ncbi:MAG: FAD-dependent oxidoreductase [Bulleidia sp.]
MKTYRKLISVLLSLTLLSGCGTETKKSIRDGVYTGSGTGYNGTLKTEVTISDHKITKIDVMESTESEIVTESAVRDLTDAVISSQSINVDTVSGATQTCEGFLESIQDVLHQAGADMSEWTGGEKVSVRNPKKEITSDVAVIGGGTSGLSTALRLQQMGVDTTIIEKQDSLGGVLRDVQDASQITGIYEGLKDDISKAAGGSEALVDVLMNNLEGTLFWQENDLGIPFEERVYASPDYAQDILQKYDSSVNTVGELLGKEAQVSGAGILFSTEVTEVRQNIDGAVVYARSQDGTFYTITCRYAVIATGSDNLDNVIDVVYGSTMKESDGRKLAQQAGMAMTEGKQTVVHTGWKAEEGTVIDVVDIMEKLIRNGAVIVNSEGERFVDETGDRQTISDAIAEQTSDCYLLLSRKAYDTFRSEMIRVEEITDECRDRISSDEGNDILFPSSWQELNEIVPVENTLKLYENFVYENSLNLRFEDPLGRSDFRDGLSQSDDLVLVKLSSYCAGSGTGIQVDEHLHVLDEDGNVMEHVLAVGNAVTDICKDGTAAGLRNTWAFVSGKVAADTIGSVLAEKELQKLLEREKGS